MIINLAMVSFAWLYPPVPVWFACVVTVLVIMIEWDRHKQECE